MDRFLEHHRFIFYNLIYLEQRNHCVQHTYHTYTHIHSYIYTPVYIYIEREREREKNRKKVGKHYMTLKFCIQYNQKLRKLLILFFIYGKKIGVFSIAQKSQRFSSQSQFAAPEINSHASQAWFDLKKVTMPLLDRG